MDEFVNPLEQLFQEAANERQLVTMEMQERERAAHELFESLNEDQLLAVKDIISGIVYSAKPEVNAAYWRGYAKHALKERFGKLPYKETVTDDDVSSLLRDDGVS